MWLVLVENLSAFGLFWLMSCVGEYWEIVSECFGSVFGGRKVAGKGPRACVCTAQKQGKCRVLRRPFWPGSKVHVQTYEFIRPDVGHSAQFLGDVVCTSGRMGGYVRT